MDSPDRFAWVFDVQKVLMRNLSVDVFYDVKTRSSFCWRYFGNLVMETETGKTVLEPDKVFCFACLTAIKMESQDVTFGSVNVKSYKRSVSTGNLTRHLRELHMIMEDGAEESEPEVSALELLAEPLTDPLVEPPPKRRRTRKAMNNMTDAAVATEDKKVVDREQLTIDLVVFCCKTLMPFDLICEGTINFFTKYDVITTSEDLPSPAILRFTIDNIYEIIQNKIQEDTDNTELHHLAFTFEPWTDPYRRISYVTTKVHYLTSDFTLKTFNMGTKTVMDITLGEAIKNIIRDTRSQLGFHEDTNNPVHTVTYTDENMKQDTEEDSNQHHQLCIGQAFHKLVTIDGIKAIPEIESLILKCKNILQTAAKYESNTRNNSNWDNIKEQVSFINELDSITEYMEADECDPLAESHQIPEEQVKQQKPPAKLLRIECVTSTDDTTTPTPTPTRWHIVGMITQCFMQVESRSPINKMLKICKAQLSLTKQDWNLLEELDEFLKKFQEAVEVIASQKTCTINLALLFRSEIKDILLSNNKESAIITRMKRNMLDNIDKRFPCTKTLVAAALLDNRFISLKEVDVFLNTKNTTRAAFLTEAVKEVMDQMNVPCEDNSMEQMSLVNKLVVKHCANTVVEDDVKDPVERECRRYLATADQTEPKDGDLLSYWSRKQGEFKRLGALARALLCVPATSAPPDLLFTTKGLDFSTKRSRLNPTRLNKMLSIRDNYDEFQDHIASVLGRKRNCDNYSIKVEIT